MAELPDLVQVADEFEERGLRVVALSLDGAEIGPTSPSSAIEKFVNSRGIALDVRYYLAGSDESADRLTKAFAIATGGLPVTVALDARGEVVQVLEGAGSRETFRALAERALR